MYDQKRVDARKYTYVKNCRKCNKFMRLKDNGVVICQSCRKTGKQKMITPRQYYYARMSVFARDNLHCQLCEKDLRSEEAKPHVHHIDTNRKNNSLTNLVLLCSKCHGEVHAKYRKEDLTTYNFHQLFKIKPYTEAQLQKPVKKHKPFYFKNCGK